MGSHEFRVLYRLPGRGSCCRSHRCLLHQTSTEMKVSNIGRPVVAVGGYLLFTDLDQPTIYRRFTTGLFGMQ